MVLTDRPRAHGNLTIWVVSAGVLALCILGLAIRYWPFERKAVLQNLAEAGDSRVQVRSFHAHYFPFPGCDLEGVVFARGSGTGKPLIAIEKLTIEATYIGMLHHHISRVVAQGMQVTIPPFGTEPPFRTTRSNITVGEIVADGTTLDFATQEAGAKPLRFEIHQATLRDVGWTDPLTYQVKLRNPQPPGEIASEGKFGVWNETDPGQTPLSGHYNFQNADLGVFHGIAGTLSSTGSFEGRLGHINVTGSTDTPNFVVEMGGHPTRLTSRFTAYVDGTRGDTFLQRVDAEFRKTHIVASGSIAKDAPGKDASPQQDGARVARLDLSAENGRIEDLLSLFVKKERAPMSGSVGLKAKVELPSGDEPFLKRVVLQGGFGIGGGKFAKESTQAGINKLSAGARGEKDPIDPETVLTDLTAQVSVRNGIAAMSDLSFGVPGASARMKGNYGLISHKIDLRGQLQLDSKISNTTSGARAFLLKMMDPFFKKRQKGEILPVKISGTYEHPTFGLAIEDEKAEHVRAPAHKQARPL